MSVSKPQPQPVNKKPRIVGNASQANLLRTESVDLGEFVAAASVPPSTSPLSTEKPETARKMATTSAHPKGHKVRELSDVWKNMDAQDFLHLSDTLTLGDVWFQPTGVVGDRGAIANVKMLQIVDAPHIKKRETTCKMSTDDILKVLYLNDTLQLEMQGLDRISFEEWLNEKSAGCVKNKGIEEGSNRAKLCEYILNEDKEFTFYPRYLKGKFGIFFRKICYHSYKTEEKMESKMINPSMIKCCATKGKFEYILEARIIPLPENWFSVEETLL